MAKFVVHKRGFFYTDESFEPVDAKGSIAGIFSSLEEAKIEKRKQDIISIQRLGGENAVDFFFHNEDFDEILERLKQFYKSEYNIDIQDDYFFELPESISSDNAERFLDILNLTFHDVVEYNDDAHLDPNDFNLEEMDLGEF